MEKMMTKLSTAEIIKLIGLYRSHSLLWDINNKAYRLNHLKIKAYHKIGLKMHLPADIVKRKLRGLRTTYTAEKKKIADSIKSGSGEVYVPTISWYNEMSFLDNLIQPKDASDNSKTTLDFSHKDDNMESEAETCDESYPDQRPNKRPRVKEQSKFDEALEKLIDINDRDKNEFSSFGISIGQQLQKLPEEDAYELMGDIQNLLTQRKLENLRKQRLLQKKLRMSDENTVRSQSSNSSMEGSSYSLYME